MADCIDCGKKIGFLNRGDFGRCDTCSTSYYHKRLDEEAPEQERLQRERALNERQRVEAIEAILLSDVSAHGTV